MAARIYRDDRNIGGLIGMAAVAGAVGALLRGLYFMITGAATGAGAWSVPDLAGRLLTGTVTNGFSAGTSLGGLVLHLVTGAVWGAVFGLVIGYLIPRALSTNARTAITGVVFGVVTYFLSQLIGASLGTGVPDALIGTVNAVIGHLIFGVVTAYTLRSYSHRPGVRVAFARDEARVYDRDEVLR